jgi:hypothetical protein
VATIGTLALAGVLGVAASQVLPRADRGQAPDPATRSTDVAVVTPTASTSAAPTATASTAPITTTASTSPSRSSSTTTSRTASRASGSPLLDPATALLPASALPTKGAGDGKVVWSKPERSTDGSYWSGPGKAVTLDGCWRRPLAHPRQEIVGTYASDYMAAAVEVVVVAADAQKAQDAYFAIRDGCRAIESPRGSTITAGNGSVITMDEDTESPHPGFQLTQDVEANGEVGATVMYVVQNGDRIIMLLFEDSMSVSGYDLRALQAASREAENRVAP